MANPNDARNFWEGSREFREFDDWDNFEDFFESFWDFEEDEY